MKRSLVLVALMLVACNSPTSGSSIPSASAAPTSSPAPDQSLIVVADTDSSGVTRHLRLYDHDGKLVSTIPLKAGEWPLAAAGKRIFVQSSGRLKAIDRAGIVEDLGPVALPPNVILDLVPSPDGTRWLWYTSSNSGGRIVSSIHEAGDGMRDRVVATGTSTSPIHVFAWTPAAILISHYPSFPFGIEAVTPFTPRWPILSVDSLDLASGVSSVIAGSTQCKPGDLSVQRVYACFVPDTKGSSSGDAARVLRLMPPTGRSTDVQLPQPQFSEAGAAWFSPSGTVLTLGGWDGNGHFNYPGQPPAAPAVGIHTYMVDLTGRITPFGPQGAQPALGAQTWLAGGRVLLQRRTGAVGGDPGLFILDTNGEGPFIRDPCFPVGILS